MESVHENAVTSLIKNEKGKHEDASEISKDNSVELDYIFISVGLLYSALLVWVVLSLL